MLTRFSCLTYTSPVCMSGLRASQVLSLTRHLVPFYKFASTPALASFHHFHFHFPGRTVKGNVSQPSHATLPDFEIASDPSTRKLLDWAKEPLGARTVEVIKHKQ
ncbi:hypothetical protein JCM11641_006384 [Rhodosporidiobolus odoratus]